MTSGVEEQTRVRLAVLRERFIHHLRTGAPADAAALAPALLDAGYLLEGTFISHSGWCEGVEPWSDRRIFIGRQPPNDASLGELWLDTVEVTAMVFVEEPARGTAHLPKRVWLSLRPVARWQFQGFMAVAKIVSRQVQIAPRGLRSYDPARLHGGSELDPMTNMTQGEATLYTYWFGKVLAGRNKWAAAARTIGDRVESLWSPGLREWTGEEFNEEHRVRISARDWQLDLVEQYHARGEEEDAGVIVGEFDFDEDTGLRTAAGSQLHTSVGGIMSPFEPIALGDLFRR